MGHLFYGAGRPSHTWYCGKYVTVVFVEMLKHLLSIFFSVCDTSLGNSCVLSSHEKKIICSSQKIRTEKWRSGWKRSINNSCCWGATVVQINSEKKVEIFVCNMSYINKILFEYNAIYETDIWIGIWYERFHNHTYLMFVM